MNAFRSLSIVALVFVFFSCDNNEPPAILESEIPVNHNQSFSYTLDIQDPEGDPLMVTLTSNLPTWLTYDEEDYVLRGTEPGWNEIDRGYTLKFQVSDGENTVTSEVIILVELGPIDCSRHFGDPAESLYSIPIGVGKSTKVTQGGCRLPGSPGHVQYFVYDLGTTNRDTVYAARAGQVITVRENQLHDDPNFTMGKENFLYIKHVDGTVARYVHFVHNGVLVDMGQQVVEGDPIAIVGRSLPTSIPHVHFDVFHDDRWNKIPFDMGRRYSIPINFYNVEGRFNAQKSLIQGETYAVLPRRD